MTTLQHLEMMALKAGEASVTVGGIEYTVMGWGGRKTYYYVNGDRVARCYLAVALRNV